MALVKILTNGTETGLTAANKINTAFDVIDELSLSRVITETGVAAYMPDLDNYNYFEYTVTENYTIHSPVNQMVGRGGTLVIKQDGVGGWIETWGTDWIFPNGDPTLDTTAGRINFFRFMCVDTNKILIEYIADL